MRTVLVLTAVLSVCCTPALAQETAPTGLAQARAHLFAGRYQEALDATQRLSSAGSAEALVLRARILSEVGRYDEALEVLGGTEARENEVALARALGEVLIARGRWDEAEAAFRLSAESGAWDANVGRLRLAELDFARGRRDEALAVFDSFIDLYNGSASLGGEDLLAVATAVSYLGRREPNLFQDALRAYDEAAERLPGDPRPIVAAGDLFRSKYVSPDAYDEYRRVLERNPTHPEALFGRARTQDFDGSPEALATARAVLETNPNHVGARVLIARIHLKAEALDEARDELDHALDVNPNSLEALAVLAAVHHLRGDEAAFDATVRRSDALNPVHAGIHTTVAALAADTRKYEDAVELAAEAVRRDPEAWEALGVLASNQLRAGLVEEGRANMEIAFAGDPFNPWFKNTLDLLDTFERYETIRTEHFEILIREDEADLLEGYVTELAEEAYAALARRYGAEPPTPIRLELFPSHADFSVRALGLTGLGALGVSFGSTLVMDSPSAREVGEFNWASVLWHELAHAFHLGISDHNVPRWFSEGLAVREQRVARERWGHRASPAYLQAWSQGMMPPLSRMNEGFVRPSFPQQVVFSYLQASLAFDWIEEEWGFDAIRAFLDGYRDGEPTGSLARSILGMDAEEMDSRFAAYVEERFRSELAAVSEMPTPVEGHAATGVGEMLLGGNPDLATLRSRVQAQPDQFMPRLALGQALMAEELYDEAEEHLREALRLFPAYPAPDGPLYHLAVIHEARGERREAADALRRLGTLNESAYLAHLEEARLRRELGEADAERVALDRAVEIFPYEPDLHVRLAELNEAAGNTEAVVLARQAVLALDPVDRAGAHYRLARALLADGRRADARRQVLRALEIAPTYDDALELLLELRGGGGS